MKLKYLFYCLALIISIGLNFTSLVSANNPASGTQEAIRQTNSGEANVYSFSTVQLEAVANAAGQLIITSDPNEGQSTNYSAIPAIAKLIDYTIYQKPLSSTEYIADVLHHLNIAQPAYAQGVGFSSLQPVLGVWKAFRNIAYFLYVLVFVVVGFMIMFRAKLNPQTVVTLQESLPNLVFTLILITFSYAIAGFVVDLIYLSIYLITGLFALGGLISTSGADAAGEILGKNIIFLGWQYLLGPMDAAGMASRSIGLIVQDIFSFFPGGDKVIGAIGSVVAYLIIAIAVLIALVRSLFTLLRAYISIIVATVFAPINILLNAIPTTDAFINWLRGLIAAAAVFPAAALMIMLGIVLVGPGANFNLGGEEKIQVAPGIGYGGEGVWYEGTDQKGFVPPLVLPGNVGTASALQAIIGIGIIMLIPEVLDLVRARLGVKDELGELAMKNMQTGYKPITTVGGVFTSAAITAGSQLGMQKAFLAFETFKANRALKKETAPINLEERLAGYGEDNYRQGGPIRPKKV